MQTFSVYCQSSANDAIVFLKIGTVKAKTAEDALAYAKKHFLFVPRGLLAIGPLVH